MHRSVAHVIGARLWFCCCEPSLVTGPHAPTYVLTSLQCLILIKQKIRSTESELQGMMAQAKSDYES